MQPVQARGTPAHGRRRDGASAGGGVRSRRRGRAPPPRGSGVELHRMQGPVAHRAWRLQRPDSRVQGGPRVHECLQDQHPGKSTALRDEVAHPFIAPVQRAPAAATRMASTRAPQPPPQQAECEAKCDAALPKGNCAGVTWHDPSVGGGWALACVLETADACAAGMPMSPIQSPAKWFHSAQAGTVYCRQCSIHW